MENKFVCKCMGTLCVGICTSSSLRYKSNVLFNYFYAILQGNSLYLKLRAPAQVALLANPPVERLLEFNRKVCDSCVARRH